jgi:hypothetical protein
MARIPAIDYNQVKHVLGGRFFSIREHSICGFFRGRSYRKVICLNLSQLECLQSLAWQLPR